MTSERKWKTVPFSSTVGASVRVLGDDGAVEAILSIMVPRPSLDYRAVAEPLAAFIEKAGNNFDSYGLALMMIREGCADPARVAAAALSRARQS